MTNTTIRDYRPLTIDRRMPFIPTMLDSLAFNLNIADLSHRGKVKDVKSALSYILIGRGYSYDRLSALDKATADCAIRCADNGDYASALDDLRTLDFCLLAVNRKRVSGNWKWLTKVMKNLKENNH